MTKWRAPELLAAALGQHLPCRRQQQLIDGHSCRSGATATTAAAAANAAASFTLVCNKHRIFRAGLTVLRIQEYVHEN
ncbi:uncharacterized protein V6R79_004756 [Siganus canaliculatus]